MATKKVMREKIRTWLDTDPTHDVLTPVYDLIFPCSHPLTERRETHWGGTRCDACNKNVGGWWCSESPDRACHYHSDQKTGGRRFIALEDGREFVLPEDHDHTSESIDWCIFCNEPEERK